MWAFLLQVLHGNTACRARRSTGAVDLLRGCLLQRRARLPLAVYQRILQQTSQAMRQSFREPLWRGHRTFYVDGTGFSMPDTKELREHFGQSGAQRAGCGFPVAHLLAMFDAATGLLVKMMAAPLRTHDLAQVANFHPELHRGIFSQGTRRLPATCISPCFCGPNCMACFARTSEHWLVFARIAN